jgi:hypothetical protein
MIYMHRPFMMDPDELWHPLTMESSQQADLENIIVLAVKSQS